MFNNNKTNKTLSTKHKQIAINVRLERQIFGFKAKLLGKFPRIDKMVINETSQDFGLVRLG